MSGFTSLTINKWIRESSDMTRRHPDLWVHEDRGIEESHIFSFLDEVFDPEIFDIFLHERTEWTIVPGVRETSVDLRTSVDKTFGFREGDE